MKKATHRNSRDSIEHFQQIINVGKATEGDFRRLGFSTPQDLIGQDPLSMYQKICKLDSLFHDPCVLDVFMASVSFMNGHPPRTWWEFTEQRKSRHSNDVEKLRRKYAS